MIVLNDGKYKEDNNTWTRQNHTDLTLNRSLLKSVDRLSYLGSTVISIFYLDEEINTWIGRQLQLLANKAKVHEQKKG